MVGWSVGRWSAWEMKIGKFRVLYGVVPNTLLITHVFRKKSQKTPVQDLELGAKRLEEMTS